MWNFRERHRSSYRMLLLFISTVIPGLVLGSGTIVPDRKAAAAALVQFADSFEGESLSGAWTKEYVATDHSPKIVSTYAAEGKKSWRAELWISDPTRGKRAEIARKAEGPREEHWYYFSIYLPNSETENYEYDVTREALAQWHNVPDVGEEWTSPPLSLQTNNGRWEVHRLWDDAPLSTNTQIISVKHNVAVHDLGSYQYDKGRWINWVFHVKWGWLAEHHPLLEVYKNGVLVLNQNGKPNMTNDKSGVYQKLGIYKWVWKNSPTDSIITKRIVYYDDIRVEGSRPGNEDIFVGLGGSFEKKKYITRAEYVVNLMKTLNLSAAGDYVFADTADHWAKEYIAAAYMKGILKGYGDGTFGPDDPLIREQMTVMALNAVKADTSKVGRLFADDARISSWSKTAVYVARGNGIIAGYADNTFRPMASASRLEAETVLNNLTRFRHD